ncbi:MAG: alpha/beta hydrolase [Anaerolineales bacterium]|nr:alpha/beta hydrolase [Anaerolineales bacterium]
MREWWKRALTFLIILTFSGILCARIVRTEKLKVDKLDEGSVGGDFIDLPAGRTHYELAGPEEGEVVVLVPGFSVPYYVWDPTLDPLVESGLRVLRYDLYGRGFSDRPSVVYDLDFFVSQLENLLEGLNINQPVHLVGLSMGGPITAHFSVVHSERVSSITLIAPEPGRTTVKDIFPLNLPVIGEVVMKAYLQPVLLPKIQTDDFYQPDKFPQWEDKYRVQMKYQGTGRALLSTIRQLVNVDPIVEYQTLAGLDLPVLLIWGTRDQTFSRQDMELVRQALPEHVFYSVPESGHLPHYERPDLVNPLLIGFFIETP